MQELHKRKGRVLLADEMGLGKSAQALTYLGEKGAAPFVIVSEASTKENWDREVAMWLGKRTSQLHGRHPDAGGLTRADAYVVNYDILPGWVDRLRAVGCKHAILDECHNITNPDATRTHATRALCKGFDSVIGLTGTPMPNMPADMWPMLNIIRPDIWPSRYAFLVKHCRPKLTPWGYQATGAEDMAGLHRQLCGTIMVRRMLEDVMENFPKKTRVTVQLGLDDMGRYEEAKGSFLRWLKQHQKGGQLHKAEKAPALYKVGELVRLASREKLKATVAWVNSFLEQTDEKLVLFGIHTGCLDVLRRRCNAKHVYIDGGTPSRSRQGLVDRFNRDKDTRLFIGQLQAAGTGLNITGACHTAFAELWWSPYRHTQGEGRTHRLGQLRDCFMYYLVAMGTIEESIAQALMRKQATAGRGLNGDREAMALNVYENVMENVVYAGDTQYV